MLIKRLHPFLEPLIPVAQGFGKRLEPRVKSNHAGAILCRRHDPSRTITKIESDVRFGGHKGRIEETAGIGVDGYFKETADTSLRAASLVGWWGCQGNTNRVNHLCTALIGRRRVRQPSPAARKSKHSQPARDRSRNARSETFLGSRSRTIKRSLPPLSGVVCLGRDIPS